MSEFADERVLSARYLHAIRTQWPLIAMTVAVAVAVAGAYSYTAPKRYKATAELLVTPVQSGDDTFLGIGLLRDTPADPNRTVITAARFVKTQQTIQAVTQRLGSDVSDSVTVTPVGQANLVSITATDANARRAATIANAFAEATIQERTNEVHDQVSTAIRSLNDQLRAIPASARAGGEATALRERMATLTPLLGENDPTLQPLTPAEAPNAPAWPRPKLSIAVAFMAALLLGIGLAVARELGSPRVDREEELLFVQRLPILARVPRVNRTRVLGDLTGRKPVPGAVWEAFRTLRANLAFTEQGGGKEFPQTILITSAMPAEGKTFAAVNLATAIAASGQRVVLVDGDLRRPSLSALFGIRAPDAGFVDLVTGDVQVELPLIPAPDIPNLQLVLATPHEAELIDLLEFRRVEHMLNDLKKAADVIIIDSSPLTEVADALTLADAADVVLVAVRLGHTRRDQLNELRRMLERRGAVIAGLVVTTKESPRKRSYYGAAPNLSRLQNMASQEEPPVLLERRRVRKGERNR